jgi:hypothetical protein
MRTPSELKKTAFAILLSVVVLQLNIVGSAAQDSNSITPDGDLSERYAEAQISGEAVVGVVFNQPLLQPEPTLLAAIPSGWGKSKICVRLASNDGRYTGTQNYDVGKNWSGKTIPLPWKSRHLAQIKKLGPIDMAVLVKKGSCADGSDLTVGSWNGNASGGVMMQVNSFGADQVYIFAGQDAKSIDCKSVLNENHLAYDFLCPLPTSALKGADPVKIEIDRVRQGQVDEPVTISIDTTSR